MLRRDPAWTCLSPMMQSFHYPAHVFHPLRKHARLSRQKARMLCSARLPKLGQCDIIRRLCIFVKKRLDPFHIFRVGIVCGRLHTIAVCGKQGRASGSVARLFFLFFVGGSSSGRDASFVAGDAAAFLAPRFVKTSSTGLFCFFGRPREPASAWLAADSTPTSLSRLACTGWTGAGGAEGDEIVHVCSVHRAATSADTVCGTGAEQLNDDLSCCAVTTIVLSTALAAPLMRTQTSTGPTCPADDSTAVGGLYMICRNSVECRSSAIACSAANKTRMSLPYSWRTNRRMASRHCEIHLVPFAEKEHGTEWKRHGLRR
eukprot:ANDGO_07459.mRNA.1 hypothetical protein